MNKNLIFLLLIAVAGCKKTTDDPNPSPQKPVISVIETSVPKTSAVICGEYHDNILAIVAPGSLVLKLRFQSEQSLSQAKLSVHSNFDCHSHGRVAASGDDDEWELTENISLTGKDTTLNIKLDVPEQATPGNYDLIIRLLDVSGNESDFTEFPIIVEKAGVLE